MDKNHPLIDPNLCIFFEDVTFSGEKKAITAMPPIDVSPKKPGSGLPLIGY